MPKLFAFGDSFVVGDQDDFGPGDINYNPDYPATHGMGYSEREEYLKYNISFAALMAKQLGMELVNCAERGAGNFRQLDLLYMNLQQGLLRSGDIVLWGICSTTRDRTILIRKKLHQESRLICQEITDNIGKFDLVEYFDLYTILSALETLRNAHAIDLFAINLFSNTQWQNIDNVNYDFDFYFGNDVYNNTLVNVLTDTWGHDTTSMHVYHTDLDIPPQCQQFFTWNKHPSVLGHQKIAEWLLAQPFWDKMKLINVLSK